MSLRARLTLFFIVIVVVPVTAATAYGWSAVARTTQRQVRSELELARASAQVAFDPRDGGGHRPGHGPGQPGRQRRAPSRPPAPR